MLKIRIFGESYCKLVIRTNLMKVFKRRLLNAEFDKGLRCLLTGTIMRGNRNYTIDFKGGMGGGGGGGAP